MADAVNRLRDLDNRCIQMNSLTGDPKIRTHVILGIDRQVRIGDLLHVITRAHLSNSWESSGARGQSISYQFYPVVTIGKNWYIARDIMSYHQINPSLWDQELERFPNIINLIPDTTAWN